MDPQKTPNSQAILRTKNKIDITCYLISNYTLQVVETIYHNAIHLKLTQNDVEFKL